MKFVYCCKATLWKHDDIRDIGDIDNIDDFNFPILVGTCHKCLSIGFSFTDSRSPENTN